MISWYHVTSVCIDVDVSDFWLVDLVTGMNKEDSFVAIINQWVCVFYFFRIGARNDVRAFVVYFQSLYGGCELIRYKQVSRLSMYKIGSFVGQRQGVKPEVSGNLHTSQSCTHQKVT